MNFIQQILSLVAVIILSHPMSMHPAAEARGTTNAIITGLILEATQFPNAAITATIRATEAEVTRIINNYDELANTAIRNRIATSISRVNPVEVTISITPAAQESFIEATNSHKRRRFK